MDYNQEMPRDTGTAPVAPVPFIGLKNLGNSCFFNSVLQILFFCPGFQNYLNKLAVRLKDIENNGETFHEEDEGATKVKSKYKLLLELHNLFGIMRRNQSIMLDDSHQSEEHERIAAVWPNKLMEAVREVYPIFEPYTQQDAQECLRCMLDTLHDALSTINGKHSREITGPLTAIKTHKLFGGRKPGDTYVVSKIARENLDPDFLTHTIDSRTTASRKRSAGEHLEKSPKAKSANTVHCLKNTGIKKDRTLLSPITENTNYRYVPSPTLTKPVIPSQTTKPSLIPKKKKLFPSKGNYSFYIISPSNSVVPAKTKTLGSLCAKAEDPTTVIQKLGIQHKAERYRNSSVEHTENGIIPNATIQWDFIKDLFQGKLINEVQCIECENYVQRIETFMDVSLPVREGCDDYTALNKVSGSIKSSCSVAWGLSTFTSHEILCGENKYYCENCHRYVEGERKVLFHSLPPILTLHLKRFTSNESASIGIHENAVAKINSSLHVPLELALDKWSLSSCRNGDSKYVLFGIIIHSGITIGSGHYLAYVRHRSSWVAVDGEDISAQLEQFDDGWLEADDDRVKAITNDELMEMISPSDSKHMTQTPYLLFYREEKKT